MIHVIQPGLLSSIQDLGRSGYRQYGISTGGAADPLSHILANLLVGNSSSEATIEMTLTGATLSFARNCMIAICGADMQPSVNGRSVPMWRPVWMESGCILEFGAAIRGCRTYVAVAGGFDVTPVMNSRSTDIRGAFGGFQGRPLRKGDALTRKPQHDDLESMTRVWGQESGFSSPTWSVSSDLRLHVDESLPVRILPGEHLPEFVSDTWQDFLHTDYTVSPQSDRMGIRFLGAPLQRSVSNDILSFGVAPGTIQVPPSGKPVVLMADAQTTGGYPVVGHVATVDLPILAQRRPGQTVRFEETTVAEAQQAYRDKARHLKQMEHILTLRMKDTSFF